MKKNILSIGVTVICLFSVTLAKAQYDAMFTQYMYNEMFINPAYAGSKEAMSATLLHRQQWMNFSGRPVTTTFSLHGPLAQNKMGLGLSVLTEKFGVTNRNLAYISYAYRIVTGKKSSLRLGLQAGLHNQVQRFSELKTNNDGSIDPLVMQNTPALNSVNFGAGAYYSTPTFYAGLSVPRMIDDQVRVNSAGDAASGSSIGGQAMHYYFTLGNMFRLSEDLGLKAQAMMKSVKGAPAQLDVNANFLICKTVWLGAGYRNNAAVTAFLGLQPNPRFFIGYSYDYDLGGLQKYTNGSHEIVLSYLFYHDLKKVLSPRYF